MAYGRLVSLLMGGRSYLISEEKRASATLLLTRLSRTMDIRKQVTSLYEQYGAPALTNFRVEDVTGNGPWEAGVFTLADVNGDVVLIRRKPQANHPGLETFWWIPGGAYKAGEKLVGSRRARILGRNRAKSPH